MLKLKKIAITGGIGSGKSTACQFFEELGAFVVKADAIVHELLEKDTGLEKQVVRLLGSEILKDGKISRKDIAEKIFCHKELLGKLEKLLHPLVLHRIEELYEEACRKGKYTLFVVEIPLLFEIGGESFYDVIIAVLTEEAIARRRFEEAGFQGTEYDQRMKHQLPPSQKAMRAHYILQNNSSREDLRKQVFALNQTLQTTT